MVKRALVVENSFTDYEIFERILNELGYDVPTTEKGLPIMSYDDALSAIERNGHIELALVDINLDGDKSGIDLAIYLLKNRFIINIIFTTAHYSPEVLTQMAFLGSYFQFIHKGTGVIDYTAFKFSVALNPSAQNQVHSKRFNVICLNAHAVQLTESIGEQRLPIGVMAKEKIINKDEIAFVATGTGNDFDIPDEYVLLVSRNYNFGYLSRTSMNKLLSEEILDDSFARINNNLCINLYYYAGRKDTNDSKFVITLVNNSLDFVLSNTYKEQFIVRLRKYGLTKT